MATNRPTACPQDDNINEYGTVVNDTDREKPNSEKNLSQCHSIHHKSHWSDLGTNPGHHSKKPANNHLSYVTTTVHCVTFKCSYGCEDLDIPKWMIMKGLTEISTMKEKKM
jgi:hypothetical protein